MLERLDDIEWHKLSHAYGPASDVPFLIRDLASEDPGVREEVHYELYGNIWHQGTVYEATAYAVPFLLELVAEETAPDRASILTLLHSLATGTTYHNADDLSIDSTAYEHELAWKKAAHDAVAKGIELFCSLLDHADPMIRVAAAHTLSAFPERAAQSASFVRAALIREQDSLFRTGLVLCLGLLRNPSPQTLFLLQTEFDESKDEVQKYVAAVALALTSREYIEPAVIETLVAAVECSRISPDLGDLPWDWQSEIELERVLSRLRPSATPVVVPLLVHIIASSSCPDLSSAIDALLAVAFEGNSRAPLSAQSLDCWQRAAIDAIVRIDQVWQRFRHFESMFEYYGLLPKHWESRNVSGARMYMLALLEPSTNAARE